MLQQIRDRITGKFALAILVVIALSFVFFGLNLNFIGLGYAAKVNGEEISVAQFENAYRNQVMSLAEQGTEVPDEFRQVLREGVLDRLIQERLVDLYLVDSGYAVSDKLVTDFIQRDPTWQVGGAFSREAYYQWLEVRAIDPGAFEASQRRALEQSQLQRGVALTAFVTPAEYRRYLNLYGEQRRVSTASIDIAALSEGVEVSDEEVSAYYEANAAAFVAPESVDLAYIELRRDEIAEQIEIDEDELQQFYEASKSRYQQDEQRRASHILIPFGDDEAAAEQEAAALAERVRAGEPFEDLARQYSADTGSGANGGDLGLRLQSQLGEGLGDAVFSMDEGEIRGPVRSDFGFHVVRLDGIQSGGALPLADVRNELIQELRREQAESRYLAAERDLSDALFDAESIDALAAATGLEAKTATGYTRNGGEPFGNNQAAIDAIFDPRSIEDREISDLVELDANRAIVVAVTEHNESAQLPLDDVRDAIVEQLRNERAFEIANSRVADIESALRAGQSIEEAIEGMENVAAGNAVISRQTTDVDARLRAAVFQQRKPEGDEPRVGTVITNDRRYVVFALTEVEPGRPEAIPLAERDSGKEQLAIQSGSRDFVGLVNQLQTTAEITKSEDVLARETLFE